jgi:glycine oxidase
VTVKGSAPPGATAGDLAVVGGGVIGLAVAWRAALAGLRVTVVDPAPGGGASWAAAGMLAPVTEVHYGEQALLRLNLAAAERWPSFAAELEEAAGRPVGYRACGTLTVARDADDLAAIDDLYRFQRGLGLGVERLRGRECRRLEPGLAPGVRGGVLAPGDHQVDNRALVGALLAAVARAGVVLRAARVTGVRVAGERARGVVLDGGETLAAGAVVLAAGCWSGALDGLDPALLPPVRPVKGQLLHLRGPVASPLAQRNVRGVEVYLVPRADGRVVVGATVEEQGFDLRVTAGAVHRLLRAATELLPDVEELELTETVAGLRPGSPDNAPLLGPTGLDGLLVASGHYRNGILLTPVTADAICELLTSGQVPAAIAPFSPRRFERAGPASPASASPWGSGGLMERSGSPPVDRGSGGLMEPSGSPPEERVSSA